jgi:hypothetical protein
MNERTKGTTEIVREHMYKRVQPIGGRQEDIKIKEPKKTGMSEYKSKKTHKNFLNRPL